MKFWFQENNPPKNKNWYNFNLQLTFPKNTPKEAAEQTVDDQSKIIKLPQSNEDTNVEVKTELATVKWIDIY